MNETAPTEGTIRTQTSFCRICLAFCGTTLSIDEHDRIVGIRGDKEQSMGRGYACFKGLQAEQAHHGPARLLRSKKKQQDGTYADVSLNEAFDEISERLGRILERDGGQSIGMFASGGSILAASAHAMQKDFLQAIGSNQYFTANTIDQSAKLVSFERLGGWAAGVTDLENSDVLLLVGSNPVVSHSTLGLFAPDVTKRLKKAKAQGLKVVCIDPRKTETARYAELHLQPLPGHDAEILAAIIRTILQENWHDVDFCSRHVGTDRMKKLRLAVEPFDAGSVEKRADLKKGQIRAAAEMFAHEHFRGGAFTGTGANMSPFSNLTQHFADCLNVLCNRFKRPGEQFPVNPLDPPASIYAEVIPPQREYAQFAPSRIRGVGQLAGERLTATLADEILTPGEGQIKALIIHGGNPANCVPDQRHMVEALRSLELCVVIDPYMTVSAQLADFVIAPKMMYERPDISPSHPRFPICVDSWAQYTPALIEPPANSELVDDWRFYWEVASRLKLQIVYDEKVPLNMASAPTTEQLLDIRMDDAAVEANVLKSHPSGNTYDLPHAVVREGRPEANELFDVMPSDVSEECENLANNVQRVDSPTTISGERCSHRLTCRRSKDTFNSIGTNLEDTLERTPYNPAFLNPEEMQEMGLSLGDEVTIASAYGCVNAIVKPDPDLRRGVVSISHGWGGLPDSPEEGGTSVNLLTNCHEKYEPINAMPHMTGLPVTVNKA